MELLRDILETLKAGGLEHFMEKYGSHDVITVRMKGTAGSGESSSTRTILPIRTYASDIAEAVSKQEDALRAAEQILDKSGTYPIIITEDRWFGRHGATSRRMLAHLGIFFPVYARNCEVRRIDKQTASAFLEATHSYSDASCRYRYGLFIRRHTGHAAAEAGAAQYPAGTLIAVATFSNARKWTKADRTIRSYEWVRYSSLPGVRVTGGMGKLLEAFIEDVRPDDIMSYADLEWSEGDVYERLGFRLEERKEPVLFAIDNYWKRTPVKDASAGGGRFFLNFGSNKYRLKLTDYQ